jgi:hypothetical protein
VTPSARRAVQLTAGFGAWTVFEWATRIRNAATDSSLSSGAKAVAVGSAAGFTAMGLVALGWAWRHRRTGLPASTRGPLLAFAALTAAWWGGRTIFVWAHDHSTAFKVVHTVLAVVSITLATLAVRSLRGSDDDVKGQREAATAAAGL